MRTQKFVVLSLFIAALAGCASHVKGVDYPDTANPTEEAAKLAQEIDAGYGKHWDILAEDDFTHAQKELAKGKREIANNDAAPHVLATLGMSRDYLTRAKDKAESLYSRTQGILDARTAALTAGVRDYPVEGRRLKSLDDDFRSEISNIARGKTTTERWSELQHGYQILEVHAIQNSKLSDAATKISSAIKNGAGKNCPNMLSQAQRDLENAKNVILVNRHDEAAIAPAIRQANESAQLLGEVLAATKRPEGVINEDAAKALVMRNRQVNSLKEQLHEVNTASGEQGRELAETSEKLQSADATLKLNHALESARKEFSPEEAEVYRQGDKLLIRLKAVNFESGRADLPEHSLPLLAKVKTIAEELNPQQIVVEGHTDSTGRPQTNKVLSQGRAEAVATYFTSNGVNGEIVQAVGLGYDKPLSTNKTKAGRSQNRRVDVIITPGTSSMSM